VSLLRISLSSALGQFQTQSLPDAARAFWKTLGYSSDLTALVPSDFGGFQSALDISLRPERVLAGRWNGMHFLFQLDSQTLAQQSSLFGRQVDFAEEKSYLFFALDAADEWTRSELATLARELNSQFASPILLLVRTGETLHLAVVDRRPNKKDATREVLEKVTLIRDIALSSPHPGHLRILEDLALPALRASNWETLHAEWKRVLDLSLLNKRFFRELSDWYFHARHVCTFPKPEGDIKTDDEHGSTSLIRLITRVMFAYFLKERGLVPAALFSPDEAPALLKPSGDASGYYKAILQNLFFATLGTEINERGWKKPNTSGGYNAQFMVHNVWRYKGALAKPEEAEALFRSVPFLNGGLFECLDKRVKIADNKERDDYLDGFSERTSNKLEVPNALFFGPDIAADLNADYDTKGKSYRVAPLLNLFARYKFTVAENTPLEEEVALDPELLGKVFENLLASYNPETKATARKQSGSFYTPREIVDYMVEESLVAYLTGRTGMEEETVRGLFVHETRVREDAWAAGPDAGGFIPPENPSRVMVSGGIKPPASGGEPPSVLPDAERASLISAIESCTILDPACGSGAFPMGALGKLVALLRRLDPDNKLWRARLEQTANALLSDDARETELRQIRQVFEGDGGDYARKLYLIEKCLFGVDIQPIAIQIAKLRFFIALAIEQTKSDDPDANFGIRPLPNLETKLVAANTLLGLDGQGVLTSPHAQTLQTQLERVRADHFKARNYAQKKKLRDRDELLRAQLGQELQSIGMEGGTAQKLAHWNPYDQNQSAPFFAPRWMFGLPNGFDIVIGNPPYVFARDSAAKGSGMTKEAKDYYYAHYALAEYQVNLYPIFIEAGANVLKSDGVLCFITPNNWLTLNTNKKLRVFVLNQARVSILNFYARVFESADVDAAIVLFQKGAESKIESVRLSEWTTKPELIAVAPKAQFLAQADAVINIEALKSGETGGVMATIEKNTRPLKDIASVKCGLKAYEVGKGTPPQSLEMKNARVYHSTTPQKGFTKYLDGRDVCRYRFGWGGEYLKYGPNLGAPRGDFGLFSTPRILVRQIPSPPPYCINACFTTETMLNDLNSMNIINISVAPELVLAVLNSRLISYWFIHKFGKMQRGIFPQFKVNELAIFPMPRSFAPHEAAIIEQVELILAAKRVDALADTGALEREIDDLVFALYGLSDEEIALVRA